MRSYLLLRENVIFSGCVNQSVVERREDFLQLVADRVMTHTMLNAHNLGLDKRSQHRLNDLQSAVFDIDRDEVELVSVANSSRMNRRQPDGLKFYSGRLPYLGEAFVGRRHGVVAGEKLFQSSVWRDESADDLDVRVGAMKIDQRAQRGWVRFDQDS